MMISDLPGDLEWEILSRVPTKSLAKLQTICKRWCVLFKDPKFVEKNKGTSARELLFLMSSMVRSVSLNLKGIDPSMEFRGKSNLRMSKYIDTQKFYKDVEIYQIFHCDGLILCLTKVFDNIRLIVLNPCTGQSSYSWYDEYALGYGNNYSSGRSYKILRLFGRGIGEIEMYEFSSDSWKVLDVDTRDWNLTSRGQSLKENAYWIGFDKETGFYLLSFDFTTERFERLPLPFESHNCGDSAVLSVVKDERLSVLHQNLEFSTVMKIWVTNKILDTKDISWSNFLVLDLGKFMLPRTVMNVRSFVLDEEIKLAVCCDTEDVDHRRWGVMELTNVYIVGEDTYKKNL